MKKLVLLIVICSFCLLTRAQLYMIEKISLPATGEEFGIYSDINVENAPVIFYELQAPNPDQKVRAKLTYNEADSFISSLMRAKDIYINWSQITQQKGYTLFSKKIPTSFDDQNIDFTDKDKWHSEDGVDMLAVFFVNEKGKPFFILKSDYMTSDEVVGSFSSLSFSNMMGNPFIGVLGSSNSKYTIGRYCGGSTLTFSSPEEIDEFVNKLISTMKWKEKNVSISKDFKK